MLFPSFQRGETDHCDAHDGEGHDCMMTVVPDNTGNYHRVTICSKCLFTSVMGEEKWAKALHQTPPKKLEDLIPPVPIKPKRFLGLI